MIKPLLCAALALAGVPAVAGASPMPKACSHTDPRGDVTLNGLASTDAVPQVDILSYGVTVGATEAVAVIRTAGAGDGRNRWSLMVVSGKRQYYFTALRGGSAFDDPRTAGDETGTQFWAHAGDSKTIPARGAISDTGEVTIRVRLKDFGSKAPRRGARLSAFDLWAYQQFGIGNAVEFRDSAKSAC